MSGTDIRADRLRKLEHLRAAGMDAYPARSGRTHSVAEFLSSFDTFGSEEATLAGRILSLRKQGGICFADLEDGTGRIQLLLQKAAVDEATFVLFDEVVDQGDFVECTGTATVTKRGERSLLCSSWKMLAKSIAPIPDEWFGIQNEELRLRERYLELLLNPDLKARVERRAKFWQVIRAFYLERGFLEVETPVLENSPGGADARPFTTHHNALGMDVSLRISLELWLKRLLVAGFPKVFEIGRIFRNEGQSREHVQDYTQWESYEAYRDMHYGMQFAQDLYRRIAREVYDTLEFEINNHKVDLGKKWETIDFAKVINERFGLDPVTEIYKKTGQRVTEDDLIEICEKAGVQYERKGLNIARTADSVWKVIRKEISGPAFLIGVPASMEPLAKRSHKDPRVVERFQIILAGSEMGKGFSELNDPQDQRTRLQEQQALREAGDDEAQRLDEEYIRAMEYGMPPSFGFGMSERLFAFLENKPVHETQLFPLLRPKK